MLGMANGWPQASLSDADIRKEFEEDIQKWGIGGPEIPNAQVALYRADIPT